MRNYSTIKTLVEETNKNLKDVARCEIFVEKMSETHKAICKSDWTNEEGAKSRSLEYGYSACINMTMCNMYNVVNNIVAIYSLSANEKGCYGNEITPPCHEQWNDFVSEMERHDRYEKRHGIDMTEERGYLSEQYRERYNDVGTRAIKEITKIASLAKEASEYEWEDRSCSEWLAALAVKANEIIMRLSWLYEDCRDLREIWHTNNREAEKNALASV